MNNQNYANHRQIVPMFHYVLTLLTLLFWILAAVNLIGTFRNGGNALVAVMLVLLPVILYLSFFHSRMFSLKAQDRAIRAEENLRHYVLTGRLLDAGLSIRQIVALRFAPDEEFPALAQKAADEQMDPENIKKAIKLWRGDDYRV